jgi:LysM repeat protein
MTLSATMVRVALLLCGSLFLSGCLPTGASQLDEEREPHFMAGKRREQEMDYKGAVEEFELASEVNPRSAAAHFELGALLERDETDPAAAIYHYERYLKLRPTAGNADLARQHIMFCKQDLARTVSLAPVTEKQQHDFEQLTAENQRLRVEIEKWRASSTGRATANGANTTVSPDRPAASAASAPQTPPEHPETRPAPPSHPGALTSPTTRSHTVQPGETLLRIARKYGVKLETLMAANPGVEARRLRAGQTLNIPSS